MHCNEFKRQVAATARNNDLTCCAQCNVLGRPVRKHAALHEMVYSILHKLRTTLLDLNPLRASFASYNDLGRRIEARVDAELGVNVHIEIRGH
jgi:hypothetical protein